MQKGYIVFNLFMCMCLCLCVHTDARMCMHMFFVHNLNFFEPVQTNWCVSCNKTWIQYSIYMSFLTKIMASDLFNIIFVHNLSFRIVNLKID